MATYTSRVAGRNVQVQPNSTSAGVADAGKIIELDASGKIDDTMLPAGDSKEATASEALSAGQMVYITGAGEIALADATTTGKEAMGFVLAAVASAAVGKIYFEGINTGVAGLTPGARYYLDTTAGGITDTPLAATGNIDQYVGRAISATELSFEPEAGVQLA